MALPSRDSRRRALVVVYFAAIIAFITMFGVLTIPGGRVTLGGLETRQCATLLASPTTPLNTADKHTWHNMQQRACCCYNPLLPRHCAGGR
jgi:hypothetical protein